MGLAVGARSGRRRASKHRVVLARRDQNAPSIFGGRSLKSAQGGRTPQTHEYSNRGHDIKMNSISFVRPRIALSSVGLLFAFAETEAGQAQVDRLGQRIGQRVPRLGEL